MSNLPFPEWGTEQTDARFSNPSEFRKRSTMFERKIRRRNALEYCAGAIGVGIFGWSAWSAFAEGEHLLATSFFMQVIGILVVLLNLHWIGSNLAHSPEEDCRTHLRAQLAHQHKALSSVGWWYLGPLIPGLVVMVFATAEVTARETGWLIAMGTVAMPAAIVAGIFAGVLWLNKRAARKLAERITDLDNLSAQAAT